MGVGILFIVSGIESRLEDVGHRCLNIPIWVSVVCVHVEQFVNQVMVAGLESWGVSPLALLLEVVEVGVFPEVEAGGGRGGCFERMEQFVVGLLSHHYL